MTSSVCTGYLQAGGRAVPGRAKGQAWGSEHHHDEAYTRSFKGFSFNLPPLCSPLTSPPLAFTHAHVCEKARTCTIQDCLYARAHKQTRTCRRMRGTHTHALWFVSGDVCVQRNSARPKLYAVREAVSGLPSPARSEGDWHHPRHSPVAHPGKHACT